jgi:hypothetical protein
MIFLVFNSRAEFDQFKAEFPRALADPDTLLGEPAAETVDAAGNPAEDSRWLVAHHYNEDEAAMLQLAGADVRVGDPDGPDFGEEEVAP